MARFSVTNNVLLTLKDWVVLLRSLSFADNFKGYEWFGKIDPGQEVKITHTLRQTPTRFIVLNAQGFGALVGGSNINTSSFFYVRNPATTSYFIGKILILP